MKSSILLASGACGTLSTAQEIRSGLGVESYYENLEHAVESPIYSLDYTTGRLQLIEYY